MDRHFKSLIEPLQLFVDSGMRATKRESRDKDAASAPKCEKKEKEEEKREEASETFDHFVTPRISIDRTIVYNR